MANAFDQFDAPATANPFDKFDAPPVAANAFDQFDAASSTPNAASAPVAASPVSPDYTALVTQAQREGRPIIMVNGNPTLGDTPKNEALSTGDLVTQGAEAGLGTGLMRMGAGLARLVGQSGVADGLSKDAATFTQQEPTDTATKIGSGIGSATSLIASGGLPGALGNIGLQSQAEKLSFGSALKSIPELAAYWLLGMGAGKAIGPLVSQASPMVKALASGAASTAANIVTSAGIRAVNGQKVMPDAESLAQDALFGFGAHGIQEGRKAVADRSVVTKMLEHAPIDALQMAAEDADFRQSAPYDPKLIDAELARRAQNAVTIPAQLAKGFADLPPDQQRQRIEAIGALEDFNRKYGPPPLPATEQAMPAGASPLENKGTAALTQTAAALSPELPKVEVATPATDAALAEAPQVKGTNTEPNLSTPAVESGTGAIRGEPPPVPEEASPSASAEAPAAAESTLAGEPAQPGEAAPKVTRDEAHVKAYKLADQIADQVAKGQPDSVRTAAFDAAYKSGHDAIEGDAQFRFNPDFMRRAAQRAAGDAAKEMGVSLEESGHDRTAGEGPSPDAEAATAEYSGKAVELLNGLSAREQELIRRVTMQGDDLQDVADDMGITKQAVQQAHARALEKLTGQMEAAGYKGGPGAMALPEALQKAGREPQTTALKRAVVDVQRKIDGNDEIKVPDRAANKVLLGQAEDAMTNDSSLGKKVVDRILATENHDDLAVSRRDAATMLIERVRLRNLREQIADTLTGNLSDTERAGYERDLNRVNEQMKRLDEASRWAGTAWSDFGRLYQEVMKDDYSLEALERRAEKRVGRPLDDAERARLSKIADDYAKLQEEHKTALEAANEGQMHAEMSRIYEAEMKDLQKELGTRPKVSKPVLEIAREIVGRWNKEWDESKDALKNFFGSESGGVGGVGGGKGGRKLGQRTPAEQNAIAALAKGIRAYIGEGVLKKAEILDRLTAEFGKRVKDFFPEAWKMGQKLIDSEKADRTVKEAVKTGAGKGSKDVVKAKAGMKADMKAGDKLTPGSVAKLVRAHITAGLHGLNDVFAAVTKDVQEHYPDATERDVKKAYVDYGNAKYPSREAIATEMRELRTEARLRESIKREQEGQAGVIDPKTGKPMAAEHTGPQPDKPNQLARQLQKELNELLKSRKVEDSPEKLASRNEARKNALRNAIADLDEQLKTGKKPPEKTALQYDAEVEQLSAERDAMREKLREIEEAGRPKPTAEDIAAREAQKGVDSAAAALDRWDRILKGELTPDAAKVREPKTQMEADMLAEVDAMRRAAAEIRNSAKPKTDPAYAREQAQLKAIDKAIAEYQRRAREMDFSPAGKRMGPDTAAIAKAKAAREAAKSVYEKLKEAHTPKKTPTEVYNETRIKAINKQLAELQRRIDTGDFGPKPARVPKEKLAPLAAKETELRQKRLEAEQEMKRIEFSNRSKGRIFADWVGNVYKFAGSVVKTMYHGTVGMFTHAGGLVFRPTKAVIFWKNFGRQFGLWASKPMHDMAIYKLVHHPNYEFWKKAKAAIDPERQYTDYGLYAKWLGTMAEKGARGFDALKLTRLELNEAEWKNVADEIKNDPIEGPKMARIIADNSNKATGAITSDQSPLSSLARHPWADKLLFAPRLYASRIARGIVDPIKTGADLALDWKNLSPAEQAGAKMRIKHAVEFTATFVGALALNQALLKASGSKQKVNLTDPSQHDWLKFKIGGKEIMPDGGLIDPIRLLGQLVVGDILMHHAQKNRPGTIYKHIAEDFGQYLRGKLNPSAGLMLDAGTGQDFTGRALPTSIPHLLGGPAPESANKQQPKYNWGEWLLKQGPIPLGQGTQVAFDEMRKNGYSTPQAWHILKGLAAAAVGFTGIHIGTDYKAEKGR